MDWDWARGSEPGGRRLTADYTDFADGEGRSFCAPCALCGYADRYLALAEALERLFNRPVDLLTERSLRNPILKTAIAADRFIIYGA
jgi:hypothetical protein